jgi:hypothetical protein
MPAAYSMTNGSEALPAVASPPVSMIRPVIQGVALAERRKGEAVGSVFFSGVRGAAAFPAGSRRRRSGSGKARR